MKSNKFTYIVAFAIVVVLLFVGALVLKGQYQPQTFGKQLQTRTIVVGAVNLAYVGYMLVKPSIPLQTQRWLNPLACGVTMGVTFGIVFDTALLRKKILNRYWITMKNTNR